MRPLRQLGSRGSNGLWQRDPQGCWVLVRLVARGGRFFSWSRRAKRARVLLGPAGLPNRLERGVAVASERRQITDGPRHFQQNQEPEPTPSQLESSRSQPGRGSQRLLSRGQSPVGLRFPARFQGLTFAPPSAASSPRLKPASWVIKASPVDAPPSNTHKRESQGRRPHSHRQLAWGGGSARSLGGSGWFAGSPSRVGGHRMNDDWNKADEDFWRRLGRPAASASPEGYRGASCARTDRGTATGD